MDGLDKASRTAGCETLLWEHDAKEVIEQIRAMTFNRGADVCMDAVGFEPDRSLMDRPKAVLGSSLISITEYVVQGNATLNDIITHKLPADKIAHAYDLFKHKKEECVKVVLDPWA